MTQAQFPAGGVEMRDPVWDPWSPDEVAHRLARVAARWYVAAGWALDLWRGRQTRPHEDMEIGVPAAAFDDVRQALAGYAFDVVGSGRRWPLSNAALRHTHQTWVREPATGVYRLDVFREPHDGDTWICRRDPSIRRAYADVFAETADGVPYVRPEIVLLFKAKSVRDKDTADWDGTRPLLSADQRAWLARALELVHPGHPWLDALISPSELGRGSGRRSSEGM